MKIGFDLDGVLCDISITELDLLHRHQDKNDLLYYMERKPLLSPYMFMTESDEAFCITSRVRKYHEITTRWMHKYLPGIPVYFLRKDLSYTNPEAVAKDKIRIMKDLGIEVYIDDSYHFIKNMREIEPNIKFIQYGGRIEV